MPQWVTPTSMNIETAQTELHQFLKKEGDGVGFVGRVMEVVLGGRRRRSEEDEHSQDTLYKIQS